MGKGPGEESGLESVEHERNEARRFSSVPFLMVRQCLGDCVPVNRGSIELNFVGMRKFHRIRGNVP